MLSASAATTRAATTAVDSTYQDRSRRSAETSTIPSSRVEITAFAKATREYGQPVVKVRPTIITRATSRAAAAAMPTPRSRVRAARRARASGT